jgi:1-acyl-sn-glycerol-3-phosphate acyltransferase
MVYPITRHTLFPLLRKYITSTKGLYNLPDKNPFIIASNHISQTDPLFIIATLFPHYCKKIHFIARRGDYGPLFERLVAKRWAACILIDFNRPAACLDQAVEVLKSGDLIALFPEGERVPHSQNLLKGKTGIALLALKTGLPVLPIGVITRGEKHRLKNGEKTSLGRDALWHYLIKGHQYRLIIGQPLLFKQHSNQPITNNLLHQITDHIMEEISRLCDRKYPY